jgi:predicted DNA-binding transcriptional regulator YafY
MQIYRLFEIVYILLQQKLVTAKALAERFAVSQRTIYRDIDILGLAGIPVYTEKGKGGGISLLPDFVLNKSMLSDQEQTEILTALQGLSAVKTGETGKVLERLSTFFNKTTVDWLNVDFSKWGYEDSGYFSDFNTAILERRIAEFDYLSVYGKTTRKKTRRRVEPIQLWFKSNMWYIRGFCLSRQEVRTFKLTRIENLHITDKHFTERDLSAITPAESDERKPPEVTLKLKIDKEMFHRVYDEYGESIEKRQKDGSFIVKVTYPEDDWVYGRILSYGEYIEVLEPEHIREIIKKKTSKINKKYL